MEPSQTQPRCFYLLPKIHRNPKDWSQSFVTPPGRPIVSDCDSETYFIAEFLDYYSALAMSTPNGSLQELIRHKRTERLQSGYK